MNSLGDIFPESWRENLANENLKPGAVLRIEVPDTLPPKIKRLIIVGFSQQSSIATIFINSEINVNVLNTPALRALQHPVRAAQCAYLEHDSYIDCSRIKERSYVEIYNLIKIRPASHLGNLDQEDFSTVLRLIRSAVTIPVRIKKLYSLI